MQNVAYLCIHSLRIVFMCANLFVCIAAADGKERPQLRNSNPLPFPHKPYPLTLALVLALAWRTSPASDGWAEYREVTCP